MEAWYATAFHKAAATTNLMEPQLIFPPTGVYDVQYSKFNETGEVAGFCIVFMLVVVVWLASWWENSRSWRSVRAMSHLASGEINM